MSRHVISLNSSADRAMASRYVNAAPFGTRVELRASKRTLPQNDRMWAMLTDISRQHEHHGRKYTPDQWKVIFLQALGREMETAPTLDGSTFMPLGYSSSALTKSEMSDLIDFMLAWGAENKIEFHDNVVPLR